MCPKNEDEAVNIVRLFSSPNTELWKFFTTVESKDLHWCNQMARKIQALLGL